MDEPVKPLTTLDAQLLRGAGRLLHLLGRARVHARRIAVAPDVRRQDRLVPLVDVVQTAWPDQVVADRPGLQAVLRQNVMAGLAVGFRLRPGACVTSKWSPQQASSMPS